MTPRHEHDRAATGLAAVGRALLVGTAALLVGAPVLTAASAATAPAEAASAAAARSAAPVEGVWQRHDETFTFSGFTSHYSCDGLADKLKLLLKAAGARADVRAVGGACFGPRGNSGPSQISSAHLTFYTLAPAAAGTAAAAPAAATQPKPAAAPAREIGRKAPQLRKPEEPQSGVGAWKPVKWTARTPRELDEGDCELVEHFARELLPKFTTRNIENRVSCVPHQVSLGGINLAFESLAALPEAEKPATRLR